MDDLRSAGQRTTQAASVASAPSSLTIPDDLVYLLTTDRVGHVSAIRPDGGIASYLLWVDWDGEHVLVTSRLDSRKGENWRRNPQVSVSVVDAHDPWRYVVVRGRVTEFVPDPDLALIDKLSQRYVGRPYVRRDPREIFVITPDHVRVSRGRGGQPPGAPTR